MSERKVIGFVGVGVMGNPISKHLIALGHDVLVYDKSEAAVKAMVEAGARAGKDLQDVVNQAPIVFTSLPTPAVFTQVLTGPGGIHEGQAVKVVVDLSTVGSRATSHAGRVLLERGIDLVDAPVSGGAAGARAGTLAVMVAGRAPAVAQVKALLESFGKSCACGLPKDSSNNALPVGSRRSSISSNACCSSTSESCSRY